jgi:hypothetical protein
VYQIAEAVRPGLGGRGFDNLAPAQPAVVKVARPAGRWGESGVLLAVDALAAAGTAAGAAYVAKSPYWPFVGAVVALAIVSALALAGTYRTKLQYSALDDLSRIVAALAGVGAVAGCVAWLTGADPHGADSALGATVLLVAVVLGRTAT